MAGNRAGGLKTREKNLARNPDYYREMGRMGGSVKGTQGGFASMTPEQRSEAGRKGGTISRRGKSSNMKGATWHKNRNSQSLSSTTKTSPKPSAHKDTCRGCLQERVIYKDGFCQRDYKNKELRELVRESEGITRATRKAKRITVESLDDDWYKVDDKKEFIIPREPSLWERIFGRGR
jgi:general stress protein YciG